jgi:hypothetical protein
LQAIAHSRNALAGSSSPALEVAASSDTLEEICHRAGGAHVRREVAHVEVAGRLEHGEPLHQVSQPP